MKRDLAVLRKNSAIFVGKKYFCKKNRLFLSKIGYFCPKMGYFGYYGDKFAL